MKTFTRVVILGTLLFFLPQICGCSNNTVPDNIATMRETFSDNKYIIHACGFINDDEGNEYDYTNSKEALEKSLSEGNRLIEVDFHYTNDGTLVCGKAWGDLYLNGKQMTPGEAPTLSDYLNCKILDKFTVLTFDELGIS